MTLFPAFDAGFHVGTRVKVIARWSLFRDQLGTVHAVMGPVLLVRIDGETITLGFGAQALEVVRDDADLPLSSS